MSMVISDIKERLSSTPYTLDLEKNYEQIYMSLSGLSRELTARYLFDIEVEPLLRRNRINEFVGYQTKYDLFGFYKEDFKKNMDQD